MSHSIEIQVFEDLDDRDWNNDGYRYLLRRGPWYVKTNTKAELIKAIKEELRQIQETIE